MASINVLGFRNGSPHGKVHVLQESINNLANTNNANKGDKREIIILKKKPRILPVNIKPAQQTISVSSLISSQNTVLVQNIVPINSRSSKKVTKPKEAKIQNPPPIAVARRNARERNRVKQVNNGFATLRQHIPNEIAEIYENATNNRSSNKKLSKVETLRMAVEYIRSLECLLDDKRESKENNTVNLSMASFPSPASSESLQNSSSFEQSYLLQSPLPDDDEDEDSNPPTPLPPVTNHHYARIPGTNTFQLIPGPAPLHQYEDEENMHPLTPNSDLISQEDMMLHSNLLESNMDFMHGSNTEFAVIHPDMISSDFYSDNSLSPHEDSEYVDIKYVPTMDVSVNQKDHYTNSIVLNTVPLVISNENTLNPLSIYAASNNNQILKEGLVINSDGSLSERIMCSDSIDLKQEPIEIDGVFQTHVNSNGNVEDVLNWWHVEQKTKVGS